MHKYRILRPMAKGGEMIGHFYEFTRISQNVYAKISARK